MIPSEHDPGPVDIVGLGSSTPSVDGVPSTSCLRTGLGVITATDKTQLRLEDLPMLLRSGALRLMGECSMVRWLCSGLRGGSSSFLRISRPLFIWRYIDLRKCFLSS